MKKITIALWIIMVQTFILIPSGNATCMQNCNVSLSNRNCGLKTIFETDEYLYISGTCHVSCCSPFRPIGGEISHQCSNSQNPLDAHNFSISNADNQTLRVVFSKTEQFCNGMPLLRSNQRLYEGSYSIKSGSVMLSSFDVVKDTDRSAKVIGFATIILLAIFAL